MSHIVGNTKLARVYCVVYVHDKKYIKSQGTILENITIYINNGITKTKIYILLSTRKGDN